MPSTITSFGGSTVFTGCTNLVEVYNLSSLNITCGSSNHGNVGKYAKIIHTDINTPTSLAISNDILYCVVDEDKILVKPLDYTKTAYIIDAGTTQINDFAFE